MKPIDRYPKPIERFLRLLRIIEPYALITVSNEGSFQMTIAANRKEKIMLSRLGVVL